MKAKISLILSAGLFFICQNVIGQCPCAISTNQYPGNILYPSSSWQYVSCHYAGEYSLYSVTAGNTYEWSYCPSDGGNASYDTQLSLLDNNTLACIGYNDDFCGLSSKITWYATFTGYVRVQTNQFSCLVNTTCSNLAYRRTTGGCTNWYSSPSTASYGSSGGSGYFQVFATGTCYMTYNTNYSWINNITYFNGGYNYSVDSYTGCASRIGYIDIYDVSNNIWVTSFEINQTGTGGSTCAGWSTSPSSQNAISSGGSYSFVVQASGTCTFHVTSNVGWINNITYPGGPTVNYEVDPNSCSSRSGQIYVYDECFNEIQYTFNVTQSSGTGVMPVASFFQTSSPSLSDTFTNTSSGGPFISCNWDFGDASYIASCSSTVSHTYAAQGSYNVQLSVQNSCGQSFITHVINTWGLGIAEAIIAKDIIIYPNPNAGLFTIKVAKEILMNKEVEIEIYNVLQEKVYSTDPLPLNTQFDISNLPNGIYILNLKIGEENNFRKLILEH